MPSAVRILTAFRPSSVIGILINDVFVDFSQFSSFFYHAFMIQADNFRTDGTIHDSCDFFYNFLRKSLPSFAIRLGFVVTPDNIPQDAASLISSTLAVSMKIFHLCSPPFFHTISQQYILKRADSNAARPEIPIKFFYLKFTAKTTNHFICIFSAAFCVFLNIYVPCRLLRIFYRFSAGSFFDETAIFQTPSILKML